MENKNKKELSAAEMQSVNKSKEMISKLKNLLNLAITKQLRIKVLTVISIAEMLMQKSPQAAESFLKIFFDLFMTLEKIVEERELISTIEGLKPENNSLFTEINHNESHATWQNFIREFEKEQEKAKKQLGFKQKR